MADYALTAGGHIRRASDGALIPPDPANSDFAAYQVWVAAGGVADPLPAAGVPRVQAVLPVAFRRALRATLPPSGDAPNALAYLLAALAQPGLEDAADAFEYMVRAERADLLALCEQLGFSVVQVDAVLTLAASYPGSGAVWG